MDHVLKLANMSLFCYFGFPSFSLCFSSNSWLKQPSLLSCNFAYHISGCHLKCSLVPCASSKLVVRSESLTKFRFDPLARLPHRWYDVLPLGGKQCLAFSL